MLRLEVGPAFCADSPSMVELIKVEVFLLLSPPSVIAYSTFNARSVLRPICAPFASC
jgi:hypothetical protein